MLDWIYPRLCELCMRPSEQELCPECMSGLRRVPVPICLHCGSPVAGDLHDPFECPQCRGRVKGFDFARSALLREEQSMRLVYRLKYHRANYLAPAMAGLLSALWEETPQLLAHGDWTLVPVPAGRAHLFRRGYNQAEELARALGKLRGLRVVNALERRHAGAESQTRLSAAQRWKNALASFFLRPAYREGASSPGRRIVLVDDVYTTGSTLRACARALRGAPGVESVGAITLVRAGR